MRITIIILLLVSFFSPLMGANAQESTVPTEVRLQGLSMLWQQYNRCSSAALYMQLSYFDWGGSATDIVRGLNPYNEDKSVRLDEMIAFAETQGFKGVARIGGTIDLLKRVVAAGFPVLVENVYFHSGNAERHWMSHNRVLMGYDGGSLYFYDPLLGPGDDHNGYGIRIEEFEERWRAFNRDYLIIYRPEQEEQLKAALGEHWDEAANAQWTIQQAETDWSHFGDSYSLYNMASAQVVLGQYEEAAANFDRAYALGGFHWRFHWYRFESLEAYLAVGRYDDVFNLVRQTLENTTEVEEMYYYIGKAYEGQGNTERALANYYAALDRNANYPAAQAAIDALQGNG